MLVAAHSAPHAVTVTVAVDIAGHCASVVMVIVVVVTDSAPGGNLGAQGHVESATC